MALSATGKLRASSWSLQKVSTEKSSEHEAERLPMLEMPAVICTAKVRPVANATDRPWIAESDTHWLLAICVCPIFDCAEYRDVPKPEPVNNPDADSERLP